MFPPELLELTPRLYSSVSLNASEYRVNARFPHTSGTLQALQII